MPDACPECDGPMRPEGGCRTCVACGFSACGGGFAVGEEVRPGGGD